MVGQDRDHSKETGRRKRSLRDVLTLVKNRQADVSDATVERRSADQSRLELLAEELRPLVDAIDESDERFDLAIAKGETVRLWIDMTSFVALAGDGRTYRFLKDTRGGRIILAQFDDPGIMADTIGEYIGERVIERERAIEGEWVSLMPQVTRAREDRNRDHAESYSYTGGSYLNADAAQPTSKRAAMINTALWFLFGAACALIVLSAVFAYRTPNAL